MSDLEMRPIREDDKAILDRLLQLELYENGMEPGPDGRIDWGESLESFFGDSRSFARFILLDGRIIGFALARLNYQMIGPDGIETCVANLIEEFFVERPWRRKGFGTRIAHQLFQSAPAAWIATTWGDGGRVSFWSHVFRDAVFGRAVIYSPGEHQGFPGQCVFLLQTA